MTLARTSEWTSSQTGFGIRSTTVRQCLQRQVEARVEDHEEHIELGKRAEETRRIERRYDGFEDFLALLEPLGIAEKNPVSGAGHEIHAVPAERLPVAGQSVDLGPEVLPAIREEMDVLAQSAEDGRLVEDPAEPPVSGTRVVGDMVGGDGADQAEGTHELPLSGRPDPPPDSSARRRLGRAGPMLDIREITARYYSSPSGWRSCLD